ncbi:MAG: GrdX family protein, partial [Synergistaceae bacterium]|nr:GrdX family protein [Synergistaceae bacterium]
MDLFPFFYTCLTNNKNLAACLEEAQFVDGPALSVLKRARDLIHSGWELEANPLYGNLKPSQQPYRTLVLKSKKGETGRPV